jgi:ABC-type glycerol-3-phosphate transport system permease component
MWGLYFIGLVAYIPATPVQAYLSLTLKRIGFSTFNSNLLSIPSAVLQIILMLMLAYSSEYFGERTFHCFFGEFWLLPLLAALITLPSGGRNWGRFAITTMISGCEYFSTPNFAMAGGLMIGLRPILPPHCFCVD